MRRLLWFTIYTCVLIALAILAFLGSRLDSRGGWSIATLPVTVPLLFGLHALQPLFTSGSANRRLIVFANTHLHIHRFGEIPQKLSLDRIEAFRLALGGNRPRLQLLGSRVGFGGGRWLDLPALPASRRRVLEGIHATFPTADDAEAEEMLLGQRVAFLKVRSLQVVSVAWVLLATATTALTWRYQLTPFPGIGFLLAVMLLTWAFGPALWWAAVTHGRRLFRDASLWEGVFIANCVTALLLAFVAMTAMAAWQLILGA